MEFAFHTRLDDLDTCRALSRTSAGVARNARKARRGALLCALLCAAWLAYYVYVAVRDEDVYKRQASQGVPALSQRACRS